MVRKVEVVPYDPTWPTQAATEMARLHEALSDIVIALHHVGSTSVPGLAAKPTLDIMVVVHTLDEIEEHYPAMVALGYEVRGEAGVPGRRYFRIRCGEAHTHHVHVYAQGHPGIARHLIFRDYLREHPEAARAYADL